MGGMTWQPSGVCRVVARVGAKLEPLHQRRDVRSGTHGCLVNVTTFDLPYLHTLTRGGMRGWGGLQGPTEARVRSVSGSYILVPTPYRLVAAAGLSIDGFSRERPKPLQTHHHWAILSSSLADFPGIVPSKAHGPWCWSRCTLRTSWCFGVMRAACKETNNTGSGAS